MTNTTDPAYELADACSSLLVASGKSGDVVLAEKFEVEPWSREFYEIVFTLMERADFVYSLLDHDSIDEESRRTALQHIEGLKSAFDRSALALAWNQNGSGFTRLREHVPPVRMLSMFVRSRVSYPRLDDAAVAEIIGMVNELLTWLVDHQLEEHDFIRQAIIEGLERFRFRVEHIRWFGWGYTVESLRSVIGAYLALERGISVPGEGGMASAAATKTAAMLKKLYRRLGVAKEFVDRADFVLRAYGLASITRDAGVAGLITHLAS